MNTKQISKANAFSGMAIIEFSQDNTIANDDAWRKAIAQRRDEVLSFLVEHDFGGKIAEHVAGQVTLETQRIALKQTDFMGQIAVVVMTASNDGIAINANIWTPLSNYSAQSLVIYAESHDPFMNLAHIYQIADSKVGNPGIDKWEQFSAEVESIYAERRNIVWDRQIEEMRAK